jgi:hypothetical protein
MVNLLLPPRTPSLREGACCDVEIWGREWDRVGDDEHLVWSFLPPSVPSLRDGFEWFGLTASADGDCADVVASGAFLLPPRVPSLEGFFGLLCGRGESESGGELANEAR